MTNRQFRWTVAWLRKHFPVSAPVVIKRYPAKKNHGITRFDGKKFYIRIDSKQESAGQLDTLLHEYAHVVAIDEAYSHKDPWARIYGAIYNAFEKKNDPETNTTV